jgi:hypothetical protein
MGIERSHVDVEAEEDLTNFFSLPRLKEITKAVSKSAFPYSASFSSLILKRNGECSSLLKLKVLFLLAFALLPSNFVVRPRVCPLARPCSFQK